jgi:hypothetical protein
MIIEQVAVQVIVTETATQNPDISKQQQKLKGAQNSFTKQKTLCRKYIIITYYVYYTHAYIYIYIYILHTLYIHTLSVGKEVKSKGVSHYNTPFILYCKFTTYLE